MRLKRRWRRQKNNQLVIVDVPLLYEGNYQVLMDKVAVVYVTPEIQLSRLMKRNNLPKDEALERIRSQLSLDEKKKERTLLLIIVVPKKQHVNKLWIG